MRPRKINLGKSTVKVKIENLTEFDEMKRDFEKIDCRIRLRGGLKKKGYTEHDLDIDVQLQKRKNLLAAYSKMRKWNRILRGRYGIFLEVQILDAQGEHIFDFDGRVPNFIKRP